MKNVVQSRLGFTLIELLVVVLIIGILAAVALPQYQVAVEKARAAEAMSNISSFAKAVEVWKLVNPGKGRTFTGQCYGVGQLDIDIPSDWVQGTSAMSNGWYYCTSCSKNFCYDVSSLGTGLLCRGNGGCVKAYRANSSTYKYGIVYSIADHSYNCYAFTEADLKLCNSLSNIEDVENSL